MWSFATIKNPQDKNSSTSLSSRQGQVANDVEEFMSCGFVIVAKLHIVEDALFLNFHLWFVQHLGDVIQFMWLYHPVHNYNSIVKVASADEIVLIKHFQFVKEAKRAAGSNLFFKLPDIGDGSVLTSQDRGIIINHDGYPVIVKGQGCDFYIAGGFAVEDTILDFKKVAQCILLLGLRFF